MTPQELLQKEVDEIKQIVSKADNKSPIFLLQLKTAIEENKPLAISFMGDDVYRLYKILSN